MIQARRHGKALVSTRRHGLPQNREAPLEHRGSNLSKIAPHDGKEMNVAKLWSIGHREGLHGIDDVSRSLFELMA
jgi:hypothetical protein